MHFLKITLLAVASMMAPTAMACKCLSNGFNAVIEGTKPCCDQVGGAFKYDDCLWNSIEHNKDDFNVCCRSKNFGWDC